MKHLARGCEASRFFLKERLADERVFVCGASSKDAGAKITAIVEDYGTSKYEPVIASLLKNPPLILPK